MKDKIIKTIKQPLLLIVFLNNRGVHILNDELYLKLRYWISFKKKLNLKKPKTYNEKLQWLKLHDRNKIYTTMTDKAAVKEYVANIIGKKHIIPTIGVYEKFDDIDFSKLPNSFVIKCTHDSGGVVVCKDKNNFKKKEAKKKINRCLKKNFYWSNREWPYKNIEPRIIVEKYMEDKKENDLKDYKFFCFNGKIGIVLVCTNRQKNLEETWFDEDYNLIDLREGGHRNRLDLVRPKKYQEMKIIAKKLSKNIPHVRVDLYEINNEIYFGELTMFPAAGFEKFDDEKWDRLLGDLIDLNMVKNEK